MHSDLIEGAPARSARSALRRRNGAVREGAGTAVVLVVHVTKDGTIAGPRVLDIWSTRLLSFEASAAPVFESSRAMKNRFGGTDESASSRWSARADRGPEPVGAVPHQRGEPVTAPALPRARMQPPGPGCDPALTVRLASGATPRRAAVGWDSGRMAMILAVLEARCGLSFATAEVLSQRRGGYP